MCDTMKIDLKDARISLGMTQADVARAVGVSLLTYQLWERKVGRPNPTNLEKLIAELGLDFFDSPEA